MKMGTATYFRRGRNGDSHLFSHVPAVPTCRLAGAKKGDCPRGFTLIEMLIALTIFGMLTAAGVALLGLTVRTQATSERLLDEQGAVRRTGALLAADLALAAPRRHRDGDGRPRPAFTGGDGGEELLLALVRHGGADEPPQRIEYRLAGGRIERRRYAAIDGGGAWVAAPLLDGLRRARLRYRDEEGAWRARWDPSDAARLPAAVELVTDGERHGVLRQLFLVGSRR